jgi:FAD/FMN-containing dehydrogenase
MSTLRFIGAVEGDRMVAEVAAVATVVVEVATVVAVVAKWSDVLRATLVRGKTPPVLTEYLELSVGDTLIVGGVGAATSAFGVQSDNVIDMEVVTGKGKKVTCSASRGPARRPGMPVR